MIEILVAVSNEDVAVARQILLEYADGVGVDLCFQGFSDELETLPGKYAPPAGRLLLARDGADVVGCVALRPLAEANLCEMKRLYVRPSHRGRSIGRQLAAHVIAEARAIGYARMRLDTMPDMVAARRLYSTLGFVEVDHDEPSAVDGIVYMELGLTPDSPG
jgi:ribosomal protein S18 acetylase RimI-like enzyme